MNYEDERFEDLANKLELEEILSKFERGQVAEARKPKDIWQFFAEWLVNEECRRSSKIISEGDIRTELYTKYTAGFWLNYITFHQHLVPDDMYLVHS